MTDATDDLLKQIQKETDALPSKIDFEGGVVNIAEKMQAKNKEYFDGVKLWSEEEQHEYANDTDCLLFSADGGGILDMTDEGTGAIWAMDDDDEDEDYESALREKDLGNKFVKLGKEAEVKAKNYYRTALVHYSNGVDFAEKAAETEELLNLYSVLLSNRAHAQIQLGNLGSANTDCEKAVLKNQKNIKAHFRWAKSLSLLKRNEEALERCDKALELDDANKAAVQLRASIEKALTKAKTKVRKEKREATGVDWKVSRIQKACKERGICLGPSYFVDKYCDYATEAGPTIEAMAAGTPSRGASTTKLTWPVVLLYEEHQQSDFVGSFDEDDLFAVHLARIFPLSDGVDGAGNDTGIPWDVECKYTADKLEIFFQQRVVPPFSTTAEWRNYFSKGVGKLSAEEDYSADLSLDPLEETPEQRVKRYSDDPEKRKWVQVPVTATLRMALQHPLLVVPAVPQFHIMVKGSAFRTSWGEGKVIEELGGWEPERNKFAMDEQQATQAIQQARLGGEKITKEDVEEQLETEYQQALEKWRTKRDAANRAMVEAARGNTAVAPGFLN
jgi:tetratricopeptide (TPR) repeat protein